VLLCSAVSGREFQKKCEMDEESWREQLNYRQVN